MTRGIFYLPPDTSSSNIIGGGTSALAILYPGTRTVLKISHGDPDEDARCGKISTMSTWWRVGLCNVLVRRECSVVAAVEPAGKARLKRGEELFKEKYGIERWEK